MSPCITCRVRHLIKDALRNLETKLDDCFLRAHRKARVATRCIQASVRDPMQGYYLRLRNAFDEVPVSRRCLTDVRQLL